jgi:hypothetical protein
MTCKVGGRVLAASVAAFAGPAIASPPPRPGNVVQMSRLVKYSDAELRLAQGAIDSADRLFCSGDSALVPKDPNYRFYRDAAFDGALANHLHAPSPPPAATQPWAVLLRARRGWTFAPDPRQEGTGIGRRSVCGAVQI